ncbi:hypothetical protein H0H92_008726 [Tricholoma furcatifolium]|nr:hypothetical protein H0H92_008726 [Tricholoma furcatifolium]
MTSQLDYIIALFNPPHFTSLGDIESCLSTLGAYLTKSNFEPVLETLLHQNLVVELIVSGLHDSVPLQVWIVENFPQTASAYEVSVEARILNRLSLFFHFHEQASRVSHHHRNVTRIPKVLSLLSAFCSGAVRVEEKDDQYFYVFTKHSKLRSRITSSGHSGSGPIDLKRFERELEILKDFSIDIPSSPEEAGKAISQVIVDAQSTLKSLLDALRTPKMAQYIQEAFLVTKESPSAVTEDQPSNQKAQDPVEVPQLVPTSYPMVQPMKSALYFDTADGFGEWRILVSTRADADLREARRKDRKTFTIIVKKIKELSKGHFSGDNQKRLNGPSIDVPIFEAKMTRDMRLVYQVDSVSDYDSNVERQVLRIFGVYTHAQLDKRLWESIGRQLRTRGKEYRRRCTHREHPTNTANNVFRPATFPPLETEAPEASNALDLPADDLEQVHSLLVNFCIVYRLLFLLDYFDLFLGILADLDVAFPFQISPQERSIVEYPYSCYVIGRSGTGKTTTMLFKMLWLERAYQMNIESPSKPRQIFVTKSRVLAGKVEEYFLKLLNSLKTASLSPEELKMVFEAKRSIASDESCLVDDDDDDNWRSDIPSRFSELQDSHFPLFTTFDRLCDLIQADFKLSERSYSTRQNGELRTFVSYDHFHSNYWHHFPQPLIKNLDPALVFSEIIGIIKGSEETLASTCGYLDRKTYEGLSQRTHSTFARQRCTIYSIFEAYQLRKQEQGDFDAADRTHGILRVLRAADGDINGRKIDQLCVDEAQDNLLIDALLLRSITQNPDGLFWAGDTAQTISVGSSFRFDDLKAFLFRIEARRTKKSHGTHKPPKAFQLATNYRSHGGIVNCAQSIIDLISHFWPYSIDILAPEKGIVDGLKPVFLNGWGSESEDVSYVCALTNCPSLLTEQFKEQFLFGASGSPIEFGAQQCIIVRDELALHKLEEQVGTIGLMMTLYDSKGLEFNDVLLYNFFEDSLVPASQWRLLLGADVSDSSIPSTLAPRFDEMRHASLCAEV